MENKINSNQANVLADYAFQLENNSVPVIFEMKHFSKMTGTEFALISRMCGVSHLFYRTFFIKKRKGGYRTIQSPYPKLSYVQRWIKDNILEMHVVSNSAFAYTKGKSHIDNAKCHVGSVELLKIDLENFFNQIDLLAVKSIFLNFGYTENISLKLAKLCTLGGLLPQGAPSSPIISNIVLYDMDMLLAKYAEEYDLTYTRYADDIVFSGEKITSENIIAIKTKIVSCGFTINESKSKLIKGAQRKIVTGILVGDIDVRAPKKIKRQYRAQAYNIIKNGLSVFDGSAGRANPLYIDEVLGKGQYILSVEPHNSMVIRSQLYLKKIREDLINAD